MSSDLRIPENSIAIFNQIMKAFSEQKISGSAAVHSGLNILINIIAESQDCKGKQFNFDGFYAALLNTGFGKELETRHRELCSGAFIDALIRLGCTVRQARLFHATCWNVDSDTSKVRHKLFRVFVSKNAYQNDLDGFLLFFSGWLYEEISKKKHDISNPNKFTKAQHAFRWLQIGLFITAAKMEAGMVIPRRAVSPFEPFISKSYITQKGP